MKVSLNTVQRLIDVDLPSTAELVERVNQQLGGVEEIIELGPKYQDALIVKVVSCQRHPDADRLSVCLVDDGGVFESVERNDDGLVQIVCGANNVKSDMWAVWLPPKSIVPSTLDDDEPFRLGSRELRGVMSHGMLASAKELGIGDDHDGIVELKDNDLPQDEELAIGSSFAKTFGLDDTIIDIENKMFTHRPDLFGQLGVAREISAILKGLPQDDEKDIEYQNPSWYLTKPQFDGADGLNLEVFNDTADNVPRLMFVAMKDVAVKPSPLWLQCALVAMGSKPINNIVDATNYMMLMTSQPTHAYDYDTLQGSKIGARLAKKGETVRLLNDKVYQLDEADIVIADGERAIGLAGIMGGLDTEVTDSTKNIVLECANFDMYAVRRSSMRHGLFTDALTRFNKGQSPLQNDRVLARLMELIDGEQASRVFDLPADSSYKDKDSLCLDMSVSADFVNARLGLDLTAKQIGNLLSRTNFVSRTPDSDDQSLLITAPYWRTDIDEPEDIVEEVGRLYGFDKLPRELPRRSTAPVSKNSKREIKQKASQILQRNGANQVLTYSFVHGDIIAKSGQQADRAYKLSNALSPDLQYCRLSLVPSLLDKVYMNIRAGYDKFILYEFGKSHDKQLTDDDGLPVESESLAGVYATKSQSDDASYFIVKSILADLLNSLNVNDLQYQPLDNSAGYDFSQLDQAIAPFEPSRSALLVQNETVVGVIGEFKSSVIRKFKLPESSAGFEISLSVLQSGLEHANYQALSRYPSVSQDMTLRVPAETSYSDIEAALKDSLKDHEIDIELTPKSIYMSDLSDTEKAVTFHLKFTHTERTLQESEASQIVDQAFGDLADKIGASRG